jgi:hypothetical protein
MALSAGIVIMSVQGYVEPVVVQADAMAAEAA